MEIINFIDNWLNGITMYRLVLYFLLLLIGAGFIFSFFGLMPFRPTELILSIVLLTGVSMAVNELFVRIFRSQANVESVYITAFILVLIITPVKLGDIGGFIFLFWASVLAMASKFILAINKKHIFNPAAVSVAITAFALGRSASWWVGGNLPLMALVLIGGFLVIKKVQRFEMVFGFLATALAGVALTSISGPVIGIEKAFLHTPILFFASIMLTEPLTTPPTRYKRLFYGLLTGSLFAPAVHLGGVYSTPELALLTANIFSFAVSPKSKFMLTLKEKKVLGEGIYDFIFSSDKKFTFRPGQYLELTLAHPKSDTRGNRRYFTLASSPTEEDLHFGIKFYKEPSSFKNFLFGLSVGSKIIAGQLAGDFTLPLEKDRKFVFIAGGIGITPFRSILKYMLDKNESRPVTMFYSNKSYQEAVYTELFEEAGRKLGIKLIYTFTEKQPPGWQGYACMLDTEMIKKEVPDYKDRVFYISGPRSMVVHFKNELSELGIPLNRIKVDFFPGFV